MSRRLDDIKKQSKENNTTPSGKPSARRERLEQRGTEEYIKSLGGLDTDSVSEESNEKVRVSESFKVDPLVEKQKQEALLKESQKKENRIQEIDLEETDMILGSEVEQKLQEMKDEQVDFEINQNSRKNALNSLWNVSRENHEVIAASYQSFGTEFGLYASIPMLCKGENCIYATLYPELHGELTQPGERCPVEIAIILSKYDQYIKDLEIDPEDAVDMSILRDVIDYDVQIVRAENKTAIEGDFVKDVVVGISQTGVEIYQEQITQASEYKQKIQTARNKALNLLNSTRKDKAGEKVSVQLDPSTYTRELLSKHNENIVDGDFEEVEEEKDLFDELDIIEDVPYMKEAGGED